MSEYLKNTTLFAGITSTIGAGIGFACGGTQGMINGAKIGGALGLQGALITNAEKNNKVQGRKIEKLTDKTGDAIQKTGRAIEKIGNSASIAILKIADTWSKLALTGYAISIGLSGVKQSMLIQDELCASAFESINCAALSLTTLSLNMLTIASVLAVGRQLYKMAK